MTRKQTARTAGMLYLIVAIGGMFSLIYVPAHIFTGGDAAATVRSIVANEQLFKCGIVVELLSHAVFLVLPFALYKLLSPVNKDAAVLMVALGVMSVSMDFANNLSKMEIVSLLSGADYLRGFAPGEIQARVMLCLDSYSNGILISKVFWGLWLLPFGYLVFKSGFLPKTLGLVLMLGCLGYLTDFVARSLIPGFADSSIAPFIRAPAALGELGACLWLLIMGAKENPVVTT